MFLVFLFLLFPLTNGFDFVIDSLRKYVDPNADPCDDFYRHVCPIGSYGFVVDQVFDEVVENVLNEHSKIWEKFSLKDDYLRTVRPDSKWSTLISETYQQLCEKGQNMTNFLNILEPMIAFSPFECNGQSCNLYILDDPNCQRAAEYLKSVYKKATLEDRGIDVNNFGEFFSNLADIELIVKDISAHLDADVRDGIRQTEELFDSMKELALDWIQITPWAINNNVTKSTRKLLNGTVLRDDYGKILRDALDQMIEAELFHVNCKSQFANDELAIPLCLAATASSVGSLNVEQYFSRAGASIEYPNMEIGFAFYYVVQNTENMAASLGFTGCAVGHELSHTLIKSSDADLMTFFSKTSRNCIMNQFNASCIEFMEDSCTTDDSQVDDNGADLLGMQLAYSLWENRNLDVLDDVYEPLNVTNRQLFFYANAFSFCSGQPNSIIYGANGVPDEHAALNVRVNAMASQHPAFKQAFQCSDDSRMMKSALSQCIIYGENAPQTKKH